MDSHTYNNDDEYDGYSEHEESEEEYFERLQNEDNGNSDDFSYEDLYPIVMEDILDGLTSVNTAVYNRMKYFHNLPKAKMDKFNKFFKKVIQDADLSHFDKTQLLRYLTWEWLNTQDMLVAERRKNFKNRENVKTVAGAFRVLDHIDKVARGEVKPAGKFPISKVLALHKEGFTYKQIANRLGACESTIKKKMARAKKLKL